MKTHYLANDATFFNFDAQRWYLITGTGTLYSTLLDENRSAGIVFD